MDVFADSESKVVTSERALIAEVTISLDLLTCNLMSSIENASKDMQDTAVIR